MNVNETILLARIARADVFISGGYPALPLAAVKGSLALDVRGRLARATYRAAWRLRLRALAPSLAVDEREAIRTQAKRLASTARRLS